LAALFIFSVEDTKHFAYLFIYFILKLNLLHAVDANVVIVVKHFLNQNTSNEDSKWVTERGF